MKDHKGNDIVPVTSEELEVIRQSSLSTIQQDMCIDHPCEFTWAENCLKLIALIDESVTPIDPSLRMYNARITSLLEKRGLL